ncbi:FecR family protein [Pedobacter caeni]|uniref:FecR family protein n=1 Tax=Pedobacter caeni TaxID=288992 RepID=A0A1M5DRI5_9SPHI|nr:FecR family protein [Pedobacter caeni]SHF69638.1 FecR family protein [Pedobacter caeni]
MNKDGILLLLKKYEEGNCTPEEEAIIESWYNQQARKNNINPIQEDLSETKDLMWEMIGQQLPAPKRMSIAYWRIAAAAVILMVVGAGFYFYTSNHNQEFPQELKLSQANDIAPGGNKAYLVLADGKRIALTDAKNGTLAQQSGITITKKADGQLIYTISEQKSGNPSGFNTIETPNGGQYQVSLPDGTTVWLNAASSLKYPVSFANTNQRKVELNGEAYFEVAKDKTKPFRVMSKGQEVEVLGTHFNVNSYANEQAVRTTLFEGSVKVSNSGDQKILKPGQQSAAQNAGLTVAAANLQEVLAWKNGYFDFNDEEIQSVMRKISRWYNVDIEFNGRITAERFNGGISRYKNISQVLSLLSSTGAVHFKVEGRRIIVMP